MPLHQRLIPSRRRIVAWAALLLLVGCQSEPASVPTAPAPPSATARPAATSRLVATATSGTESDATAVAEPSPAPGFEAVSIAPLPDSVRSYQHRLQLDFNGVDGSSPITQSALLEQDVTRDPDAERLTLISTGSADAPAEEVNLLRVGTQLWIQEGDSWVAGDAGQMLPGATLSIQPVVAQIASWQLVDEAGSVAGVPAMHYRFSQANLRDQGLGLGAVEAAEGEAWVARQGGYLLRLALRVQGGALMTSSPDPAMRGETRLLYSMESINAPLIIETPTP